MNKLEISTTNEHVENVPTLTIDVFELYGGDHADITECMR